MGQWKLISVSTKPGPNLVYDGWWSNDPYVKRAPNASNEAVVIDGVSMWLFDLVNDECENRNIALANPEVVKQLQARMDVLADPKNGYRSAVESSTSTIFPNLSQRYMGSLAQG